MESPSVESDIASVTTALSNGGSAHFLDVSGRLQPADVTAIEQKVAALQSQTGARAWVVALPPKADVESYRPIYKDLAMKGRDLLIVFNGERRHLHCQAISQKAGGEILKKTKDTFYKSNVAGLQAMLDEVGSLIGPAPDSGKPGGANAQVRPGVLWVIGGVAVALLAWVVFRRHQAEQRIVNNLRDALAIIESTLWETTQAAERRPPPDGASILDRAQTLGRRLDEIKKIPPGAAAIARARALRADARRLRREAEIPPPSDEPTRTDRNRDDGTAPV